MGGWASTRLSVSVAALAMMNVRLVISILCLYANAPE
jgi:hypothetical protein